MRTKLEENCNLNEALHRSVMVMRTTVHSKTKETPFERHYGRKPRTEPTSYLNLPTGIYKYISAQHETLQVNSSIMEKRYDQLIMKTPRRLKCDVSNQFQYNFLKKDKNKFQSEYQTKPKKTVAGTEHTITANTNLSVPNSFRNPLSPRGENKRGMDGKFFQMSLPSLDTEEDEEEV